MWHAPLLTPSPGAMRWGAHDKLQRLLAAHGDRRRDLLITPDGEGADRVPRLAKHRLLPRQLLQDLRGARPDLLTRFLRLDAVRRCGQSSCLPSAVGCLPLQALHSVLSTCAKQASTGVSGHSRRSTGEQVIHITSTGRRVRTRTPHIPRQACKHRLFRRHARLRSGSHLCGLLQTIARLSNTDVEHQLRHADLPHGVGYLFLVLRIAHGSRVSTAYFSESASYGQRGRRRQSDACAARCISGRTKITTRAGKAGVLTTMVKESALCEHTWPGKEQQRVAAALAAGLLGGPPLPYPSRASAWPSGDECASDQKTNTACHSKL